MIIGIQGIQGCGKSTLARQLCSSNMFECISIDDFYLTHEQIENQYYYTREKRWKCRGNPGTHDIALLDTVLANFRNGMKDISVPVYDKGLHNGRGDRIGFRKLKDCTTLLVEGWCIGFVSKNLNDVVDEKVKQYEIINQYLDALLILKPPCIDIVYKWRVEAEQKMRRIGNAAMTDEDTQLFVDTYMWCYNEYLESLYKFPPMNITLSIQLDEYRTPISFCVLRYS